jgi:hypothetical protein
MSKLTELPAEFLFTLTLTGGAEPEYSFATPWGRRRETRARGGSFVGPRLSGSVVEGLANDWGMVADNGIAGIDANILLRTLEGQPVFVTCYGRAGTDGKVRISPIFEAPDGPLAWLTEIQAVGTGSRNGDDLVLDIYAVL